MITTDKGNKIIRGEETGICFLTIKPRWLEAQCFQFHLKVQPKTESANLCSIRVI